MPRPRTSTVAALLAAALGAALAWGLVASLHPRAIRLRDGTELDLATITTGTNQVFESEPALVSRIRPRLPAWIRNRLGLPGTRSQIDCSPGEITIWFVRRGKPAGIPLRPAAYSIQVVGPDGQRFPRNAAVSSQPATGGLEFSGHRFDAFPRRDGRIRVEVLDGPERHLVEVRNPVAGGAHPTWEAGGLPQTRSTNGLSVTVRSLDTGRGTPGSPGFRVGYEATLDGRRCDREWDVDWVAMDPTGNRSRTSLPWQEPIWRIRGHFRPGALMEFQPADLHEIGRFDSIQPTQVQVFEPGPRRGQGLVFSALLGKGAYRLAGGRITPTGSGGTLPEFRITHPDKAPWELTLNAPHPILAAVFEGTPGSSPLLTTGFSDGPLALARIRSSNGRTFRGVRLGEDSLVSNGNLIRAFGWEFRLPDGTPGGPVDLIPMTVRELEFTVQTAP